MTTIIRDCIQIVCLLAVLIWHNWLLTIVTFVTGPLLYLILRWVTKHIKRLTSRQQKSFGKLIGTIQETYNGERVVKIYNGYEYERQRFRAVNELLKDLTLKTQQIKACLLYTSDAADEL